MGKTDRPLREWFLRGSRRVRPFPVFVPMAGLSLGEQKRWLIRNLANGAATAVAS